MSATTLNELLQLPAHERMNIADRLYQSVGEPIPELSPGLRDELLSRLEQARANPAERYSYEDIHAEFLKSLP